MKSIIPSLLISILILSCNLQEDSQQKSEAKEVVEYSEITYQIDTSKWFTQNKKEFIDYFEKAMKQKSQFEEDQILGVYTINKFPVINYPFIIIIETKASANPPSLDQLEKELNATTISLDEINPNGKLKDVINNFEFGKPILIKEKRLILTESNAVMEGNQQICVRQAMFFKGKEIVAIQFSYLKDRHEIYLEDFNKIVETLEL